jgi:hypothetical protein
VLIIKNFFSFYVEFEILLYFMCFRIFEVKEHDSEESECRRDQDNTLSHPEPRDTVGDTTTTYTPQLIYM